MLKFPVSLPYYAYAYLPTKAPRLSDYLTIRRERNEKASVLNWKTYGISFSSSLLNCNRSQHKLNSIGRKTCLSHVYWFSSPVYNKSMLYNFYKQLQKHGTLRITCGKLMICCQISMRVLSTVQLLLFRMEKCYMRVFYQLMFCFNSFKIQLFMVSLSPSWVLGAGLWIWEQNPFSVSCPVQMNDELLQTPALGAAGAALGCRVHGRSWGWWWSKHIRMQTLPPFSSKELGYSKKARSALVSVASTFKWSGRHCWLVFDQRRLLPGSSQQEGGGC